MAANEKGSDTHIPIIFIKNFLIMTSITSNLLMEGHFKGLNVHAAE